MNYHTSWLWALVIGACTVCSAAFGSDGRWSIKDSIELSYFMLPRDFDVAMIAVEAARPVLSPDGKLFYVITERGNVSENINVTELRVYAVADVVNALKSSGATAPAPRAAHIARSRVPMSMDAGIKNVSWVEDSSALLFLEYGIDVPAQVKRLDVRGKTGTVETLSNAPAGVRRYRMEGEKLIYGAWMSLKQGDVSAAVRFPFSYIREEEWGLILGNITPTNAVFIRHPDGTMVQASRETRAVEVDPVLSPDGRWAVLKKWGVNEAELPGWAKDKIRDSGQRPVAVDHLYLRNLSESVDKERYLAVSGTIFKFVSKPSVLWSPDSRRVILTNAVMPGAKGVAEVVSAPALIELDVLSGEARKIGEMPGRTSANGYPPVVAARWLKPGSSFALEPIHDTTSDVTVYSLRNGEWSSRTESTKSMKSISTIEPKFPKGLEVYIKQGLNDPPRLIATTNGRELTLWDPNPLLSKKRLQRVELIKWTDEDGRTWDGHLVMPSQPKPSEGFPLVVVMAHQTFPQHFMPDGYAYAPGNAAQEMAAQGIVQLTLNARNAAMKGLTGTPDEGRVLVAAADSAVAELAQRGLIDPKRVGVMGYSRMGWASLYLATHHRAFVPAAAIVQDSADASYLQYSMLPALGERRPSSYESMYGDSSVSFWENKDAWMSAPGFMMDRMQSPLLIQHHYGPYVGGALTVLEPYGAMRHLGKPVEVAIFNGSAHVHIQPLHRLASMQLAVDWMRFWLKGEENADPEHADRNTHWRYMRDTWKAAPSASR
jgi:hypothetical protein